MSAPVIRVDRLAHYIQRVLSTDPILTNLRVEGELRNLRYSREYCFFDLQEQKAFLSGIAYDSAIFAGLHEGDRVICEGRIRAYERGSKYQISVQHVERVGEGERLVALEALRRKLCAEGLFDPDRKKPLPSYPRRIGLITSMDGAVRYDFTKELQERYPLAEVLLCHAAVQGSEAPSTLCAALDRMEAIAPDVVVLARGGGSDEHLEAFNEESVVRRVAACSIPVVSAIGHQVNWTLCDEAADARASTPTEAAILVSPSRQTLHRHIADVAERMRQATKARLHWKRQRIEHCLLEWVRHSPRIRLQNKRHRITQTEVRAVQIAERQLQERRRRLHAFLQSIEQVRAEFQTRRSWQVFDAQAHLMRAKDLVVGAAYRLEAENRSFRIRVEAEEGRKETHEGKL